MSSRLRHRHCHRLSDCERSVLLDLEAGPTLVVSSGRRQPEADLDDVNHVGELVLVGKEGDLVEGVVGWQRRSFDRIDKSGRKCLAEGGQGAALPQFNKATFESSLSVSDRLLGLATVSLSEHQVGRWLDEGADCFTDDGMAKGVGVQLPEIVKDQVQLVVSYRHGWLESECDKSVDDLGRSPIDRSEGRCRS